MLFPDGRKWRQIEYTESIEEKFRQGHLRTPTTNECQNLSITMCSIDFQLSLDLHAMLGIQFSRVTVFLQTTLGDLIAKRPIVDVLFIPIIRELI
ncbi:hypothetical protein CEXT_161571 [Caerostris extrusa]|uniref:Uncharacterized protein n=1 Tax=Caerostris extrusa TaxID=172846 RepID=A0AAV4MNS6_CAEEX|nr:hypothetical protein CEXT_161571 [Caerostris extrusa]